MMTHDLTEPRKDNPMKKISRTVFVLMCLLVAAAPAFAVSMDSVVKIFTVQSSPDYNSPWDNYSPSDSTASGCVISGKRILSNAHAVADQTFLMVRKQSSPKKYIARVLFVGHECDLSILTVDEPGFFDDLKPMELCKAMPELNETVVVLGYPIGGDTVSITAGVVSRLEVKTYIHSYFDLLAIQIDAAINPGNSGGPVVLNGRLAGIAFEGFQDANNIGYIIPVPIIRHFLKDIEDDGKYDGFCDLGIRAQRMESEQIRAYKGMKPDQTGILITDIMPLAQALKKLNVGDVLLSFDGVTIANDGTVPLRKGERVSVDYLMAGKFIGDIAEVSILRDGKEMSLDLIMETSPTLVPKTLYDVKPDYFVHAGLLFMPLTQNFLATWGDEWENDAPRKLMTLFTDGRKSKPDEQVVVLSYLLSDNINVGYTDLGSVQVMKVNGADVLNMKDLVGKIEANRGPYLIIDLESHSRIVLDSARAKESTDLILKKYRISSSKSDSLK